MRTAPNRWLMAPVFGGMLVCLTACGEGRTSYVIIDAGTDAAAEADTVDFGGGGTGGEEEDAGPICKPTCVGECVPLNPFGVGDGIPAVLLVGQTEQELPPCPSFAPAVILEGRGLFSVGESTCPLCSCGGSVGACALSSSITAHAGLCGAEAPATPTNAPAAWDGSCTNASPIKAGVTCAGALCVQSVTAGEMVKIEDACMPQTSKDAPVFPAPTWGSFGRACSYDQGACDTARVCVRDPISELSCLAWHGERDCPTDPLEKYTQRFVLYSGFKDTRACSSCACASPADSWCSSSVTLFKDGSCSQPIGTVNAGSNVAACSDLSNPPGLAIGSKAATPPLYHAGSCAALGGELEGAAEPIDAVTFCCFFPPDPK